MNAECLAARRRQNLWGRFAALFLGLAFLSLIDGLSGGMLGNRGVVELLPGDRYAISGPVPHDVKTLEAMTIEGQPSDGSVRIVPKAIFSGFWFGGAMWRGHVEIAATAPEGRHTIIVRDDMGQGKQNPALIFTVQVWPDLATRNAHAPSFITRKTGCNPFVFAGTLVIIGLIAGTITFVQGHRWTALLAAQGYGEIFREKKGESGMEFYCDPPPDTHPEPGAVCALFRPDGSAAGQAVVVRIENRDVILQARDGNVPGLRIGDLVSLRSEPVQHTQE